MIVALVVVGLAVATGAATADERPVLVIDATADGSGAALAEQLRGALGPDPALAPVSAKFTDSLARPTPTDTSWRAPAEAALLEARELLAKFAYRQAADRARGPQDRLARAVGDAQARKLLADLVFVEGLGIAGDDGVTAAAPTFALVHRLDPGRTLSRTRYAEDIVQTFAAAATPGTVSGVLFVRASGAAEVLIDAKPVGPEPAQVTVPAGPHIVTVRGDDIDALGARVDAAAGQTVLVPLTPVLASDEVRIGRARDRLLAATSDRIRADAVASLLGQAGARDAVIVTLGPTGGLMTRIYTARGGLGPARPVDGDLAGVLRPLRPVARTTPRVGGGGGRVPIGPTTPLEEPWWRQRWAKATFGATAGVLVVALVTAIVTRADGSSPIDGIDVE